MALADQPTLRTGRLHWCNLRFKRRLAVRAVMASCQAGFVVRGGSKEAHRESPLRDQGA
jgi:hypothetical protein